VPKLRHSLRSPGYPIGVGYDEMLKNLVFTKEGVVTKTIATYSNAPSAPLSTAASNGFEREIV